MAELFKGFKQVLLKEGLELERGYLYFVRTSTGTTDGYLYLNGKKYGTAEEAKALIAATKAEILAEINELADIVGDGFSGSTITKEVAALEETVSTLEGKAHEHANANVLSGITADKVTKWDQAATDDHTHANKAVLDGITADKIAAWDNKVDKENGKGLSTNDFTNDLKTKLEGIAEGAEVNVQADWNETDINSDAYIKNKPDNLVQDANYVHTDNNYTTTEKTKLGGIEEGAQVNKIEAISVNGVDATIEGKKATVTIPEATKTTSGVMSAADKSKLEGIAAGAEVNYIKSVGDNLAVNAEGKLTVTIPEAEVIGVSESSVNGLKLELKDKKVTLVDDGLANTLTSKNVTVRKKSDTTDDQCVYEILQGETVVGTINHPKDMVVTGGEVIVASTEEGLTQGEKYLKLTIANQEKPVYIAVKDLVDVYTAGNGIEISNANAVSVKINNGNSDSGVILSADASGLKAEIMIDGDDV